MVRVAIVDDSKQDTLLLKSYVEKYSQMNDYKFNIKLFANGLDFLEQFKGAFDIVFMDIEMPHLNGLDVARRLREIDNSVALIFITHMAQYAICGYEVNAIDYIVKPVNYYNFSDKLSKAIAFANRNVEKGIFLHRGDGIIRILESKIYYLEKDKNYIIFHTANGDFRERGTMGEYAKKLTDKGFAKCSSGCMVNLRHVSKVTKDTVWVGVTCLPLSRPQRKEFMVMFVEFLGGVD